MSNVKKTFVVFLVVCVLCLGFVFFKNSENKHELIWINKDISIEYLDDLFENQYIEDVENPYCKFTVGGLITVKNNSDKIITLSEDNFIFLINDIPFIDVTIDDALQLKDEINIYYNSTDKDNKDAKKNQEKKLALIEQALNFNTITIKPNNTVSFSIVKKTTLPIVRSGSREEFLVKESFVFEGEIYNINFSGKEKNMSCYLGLDKN